MRGLTLITKGMLVHPSAINVYRACSFETSIETINKSMNIKVAEVRTINILKINTKRLNVQVLCNNVNISSEETNKINIQRS